MTLSSGAFLLILMLSFKEFEASTVRKISTKKNSDDDNDRRNVLIYATPSNRKLKALTENPSLARHQTLELHGSRQLPYSLESSQQPSSSGASDLLSRFEKNKVSSSKGAFSAETDVKGKSKTKESSKSQTKLRIQNPSSSQGDIDASRVNLHATTKIGHPKKKYFHSASDIVEARRLFALPFREHSKLIQLKPFQDNQPLDFKKEYREREALSLYDLYYPDGAPNLQTKPYTLPKNRPLPLHEKDDSVTPTGYRRRKKDHVKGAVKKDVSD